MGNFVPRPLSSFSPAESFSHFKYFRQCASTLLNEVVDVCSEHQLTSQFQRPGPKDHFGYFLHLITVDLSMNVNIQRTMYQIFSIIIFQKNSRKPLPKPLPPFSLGLCIGLNSQGASHPLLWLRPRLSGSEPSFN